VLSETFIQCASCAERNVSNRTASGASKCPHTYTARNSKRWEKMIDAVDIIIIMIFYPIGFYLGWKLGEIILEWLDKVRENEF